MFLDQHPGESFESAWEEAEHKTDTFIQELQDQMSQLAHPPAKCLTFGCMSSNNVNSLSFWTHISLQLDMDEDDEVAQSHCTDIIRKTTDALPSGVLQVLLLTVQQNNLTLMTEYVFKL